MFEELPLSLISIFEVLDIVLMLGNFGKLRSGCFSSSLIRSTASGLGVNLELGHLLVIVDLGREI